MEDAMETSTATDSHSREELAASLKHMVGDAEQLLKRASQSAGQEYDSALKRAAQQLRRAKAEFLRVEEDAILHAKHAVRVTDRAVQEHPYVAMGLAAGVGVLLGILISRR
jgi:ElaB/YqjD/DUF883 family membrane-anchored ribosome-binding protein